MIRHTSVRSYQAKNIAKGLCKSGDGRGLVSKTYCDFCLQRQRSYKRNLNILVFNHYGWVCRCCNVDYEYEFLTIDHINNDGAKQRKAKYGNNHRQSGSILCFLGAKNIKKGIFPTDLQTLCMNCNFAKGKYGYCPHQRKEMYDQNRLTASAAL